VEHEVQASPAFGGVVDTDRESARIQIRILRQMSVRRRLEQADQLYELTVALALADLRRRHPGAAEPELRRLLAARVRQAHTSAPAEPL
jgi:hypothetical protein